MAHHASGFAVGFDPTGRCHKREFLLKFARDRRRWLHWLFEAKKRYGLRILDYIVTSNIDMNRVRAGAVSHPREWECSGYNEIQTPRQRYRLIDRKRLSALAGSGDCNTFSESHARWVEDAIRLEGPKRETRWTESVAVGSRQFIEIIKERLGHSARARKKLETGSGWALRERVSAYGADFGTENSGLR